MLLVSNNRTNYAGFVQKQIRQKQESLHSSLGFGGLSYLRKPVPEISLSPEALERLTHFKQRYNFKAKKPIQYALKRTLDYVGATGAIIAIAPIMILSAATIKLETKGPAIFKQTRIGKDGKNFVIYKFRSMYNESPKTYYQINSPQNPNVTKVGRVLRKYSLDELPQLFNILKGDMSLVGPRPLLLSDVEQMERIDPDIVRRFVVKPGAKLNYKSLQSDNLLEKIQTEKEYLDNWNMKSYFKSLYCIVKNMVLGQNY